MGAMRVLMTGSYLRQPVDGGGSPLSWRCWSQLAISLFFSLFSRVRWMSYTLIYWLVLIALKLKMFLYFWTEFHRWTVFFGLSWFIPPLVWNLNKQDNWQKCLTESLTWLFRCYRENICGNQDNLFFNQFWVFVFVVLFKMFRFSDSLY